MDMRVCVKKWCVEVTNTCYTPQSEKQKTREIELKTAR